MNTEKTFVMVKPDGVQRGLVGEVISRFEKKGLRIAGIKMVNIHRELASKHYNEHREKPFYEDLIRFITSGPVVAMVLDGPDAISIVRKLVGATAPQNAEPGSIRGDYVVFTTFNIVHASDSTESSDREIDLFFTESELTEYKLDIQNNLY
ncbi:MAG: nucleoside-diphosphate kinase [Acidobacteriota bacterium]